MEVKKRGGNNVKIVFILEKNKKEVKMLFSDDLILSIIESNDSTRKFLNLINIISKVAGYKINIQTQ